MQRTNKTYPRLLAIGLLFMNIWVFVNFYIKIDDDLIDFFKGFGFALVFASIFKLVKTRKNKHSADYGCR